MRIPAAVKREVKKVVGGIHGMFNAPHAVGYLFNIHRNNKDVCRGMYIITRRDIDPERWDAFFDLESRTFKSLVRG